MFGNPEIARAQISPDGKFIAFLKPHKDKLNIWVKRADEPFANARFCHAFNKERRQGSSHAVGVAIVAPSNLITLLDAIPAYWESERIRFYKRMGDPTTAEGKAQLMRQSPLTHADKIKTPLLVVQGANDPRVNKREADQIVIAFVRQGIPGRVHSGARRGSWLRAAHQPHGDAGTDGEVPC